MKKILTLFVLALAFTLAPHDGLAQKKKSKPKAKTDPTLRPSKSQKKVQKKILKSKKRASLEITPSYFATYWRKEDGLDSTI
jgi:hypothetical protein